jgi:hypothetical protein
VEHPRELQENKEWGFSFMIDDFLNQYNDNIWWPRKAMPWIMLNLLHPPVRFVFGNVVSVLRREFQRGVLFANAYSRCHFQIVRIVRRLMLSPSDFSFPDQMGVLDKCNFYIEYFQFVPLIQVVLG